MVQVTPFRGNRLAEMVTTGEQINQNRQRLAQAERGLDQRAAQLTETQRVNLFRENKQKIEGLAFAAQMAGGDKAGTLQLLQQLPGAMSPEEIAALQSQPDAFFQNVAAQGQQQTQDPSAVREFQFFQNLPDDEKEAFLRVKRSAQLVNTGGGSTGILTSGGDVTQVTTPDQISDADAKKKRKERIATALGDAQGAAQAGLGQVFESSKRMVDTVEALRNHPGMTDATGVLSLNPQRFAPGTDEYNFAVLLNQAKGQIFAQAFESLKGGGQITEFESQSVAQGLARLDQAQSQDEFLLALNDLERSTINLFELSKARAQGNFEVPDTLTEGQPRVTAGQQPTRAEMEAEARRRGLIP